MNKSTLQFLKNLKANNNKEWMDANKNEYQHAKAEFEEFVTQLISSLGKMDDALANLQAKQCIFRLNRDIRFSNDKSPYKTNFGAAFSRGGKKFMGAGYYFHLQPGNSFIGGGCWMPDAALLKNIRQEIDYNFQDFKKLITTKNFKATFGEINGDKLSRPPKGYDENNPAIEYIKFKSFTVSTPVSDKEILSADVIKKPMEVYKTMKPFIDFLNKACNE